MAKNNAGYLGVSEPISLSGPTEKDLIQTAEVEKVRACGICVSDRSRICIFFSLVPLLSTFCSYVVIGVYQFLADAGLYESQDQAVSREEVLGKLDQVRECSVDCAYIFGL
jgi:poly(A) polymerase